MRRNRATFADARADDEPFLPDISDNRHSIFGSTDMAPDVSAVVKSVDDVAEGNALRSKMSKKKIELAQKQEEVLLSKSIIKRREWMKKYNISEKIIFELFSEFSSMMMINKSIKNVEEYDKKTKGFADMSESKKEFKQKIETALPTQAEDKSKNKVGLSIVDSNQDDPQELSVPISIFLSYSQASKTFSKKLKDRVMKAFDLDIDDPDGHIDWDTFIRLNCLLKFKSCNAATYEQFLGKCYGRGVPPSSKYKPQLSEAEASEFQKRYLLTKVKADEIVNTLFGHYRDEKGTYEMLQNLSTRALQAQYEKYGVPWDKALLDDPAADQDDEC